MIFVGKIFDNRKRSWCWKDPDNEGGKLGIFQLFYPINKNFYYLKAPIIYGPFDITLKIYIIFIN